MIIKQLLKDGNLLLSGRDTAALDCEVLLSYCLGRGREYMIAHGNEDVDGFVAALFNTYLKQVKEGKPIAYILGEKEFYALNFFVDERVLVPRPETELLVDEVLDYLRANAEEGRRFRILDVGTGSGNIAVAVGKSVFDSEDKINLEQIDAVDVSTSALEVAKINVEQHGLSEIVHVYQSDLLEAIDECEKFDVIVANLPYIGKRKHRNISEDVEKFEPETALFGGEDGLSLYKKMFQQIVEKEIGFDLLIGEFGFAQRNDLEGVLNKYFDQKWKVKMDHAGIDRLFMVENLK
jgi:release factor glutamine methyltransferase